MTRQRSARTPRGKRAPKGVMLKSGKSMVMDEHEALALAAQTILKYAASGCALGRELRADPDYDELLALAHTYAKPSTRR